MEKKRSIETKEIRVINVPEFIKEWAEDSEHDGLILQRYGQEVLNVFSDFEPGNERHLFAVQELLKLCLGMVNDEISDYGF